MNFFGIDEKEKVCANCKHYIQHYVLDRYTMSAPVFTPVNGGHCIYPRNKLRNVYDTCINFEYKIKNAPASVATTYEDFKPN